MPPLEAALELSLRRSRLRARVLVVLASLGEAYTAELARACGIDRRRVRFVMLGHEPKYRAGLSLVALGLAAQAQTPHGRVWRITDKGRRKARGLTSAARARRRQVLSL